MELILKCIAVGIFIIIVGNILFAVAEKLRNEIKDDTSNKIVYTKIIVLITICWFITIIMLWFNANKLTPNNLGDFLAGTFAPILFIWVVFGILLQKQEFSNAVAEYKKSVKFLKKQSINTDIQHQNSWFDRNAEMIEKYIDAIIKEQGPLEELNTKIIGQNIYTFRDIVSNIMNIVELDKYIHTSLSNARNGEDDFNKALDNLTIEYNILFGKNIDSSKKIALKIYLHTYRIIENIKVDIERKNVEEFKNFYDLKYLITEDKEESIMSFRRVESINLDVNFVDIMNEKMDEKTKDLILYREGK